MFATGHKYIGEPRHDKPHTSLCHCFRPFIASLTTTEDNGELIHSYADGIVLSVRLVSITTLHLPRVRLVSSGRSTEVKLGEVSWVESESRRGLATQCYSGCCRILVGVYLHLNYPDSEQSAFSLSAVKGGLRAISGWGKGIMGGDPPPSNLRRTQCRSRHYDTSHFAHTRYHVVFVV